MRWVIRSFFALLLLVVFAGVALFLLPTERIARVATDKFTQITGRTLTIEGSIRPSVWPTLGVKTGPVTVSNAAWSDAGPMVQATALDIGIDMSALIDGQVRITGIRAENPRILLERARDGRENWVFGGPGNGTASPGMAGEGTPFTLDLAEISGGSFRFVDHGAGSDIALTSVSGTARIPSFTGAAAFDFTASMNGQEAKIVAKLSDFKSFLEGRLVGLDLQLAAGAAQVGFDGRGGWNPMALEGNLTADLADLAAITRLVGAARPDLPQGLGAGSVSVAGKVTVTQKASLHLRGGSLGLDGNRLQVEADLTTDGPRPKLSAQVTTGALSLVGLSGGQGGGASGGAQAASWPKEAIDVSALGIMDVALALTAQSVDLGLAKLGTTRAVLTIDRARAVFDLREIAAYQGKVTGQFVVNGRGGLSVGGDLNMSGLAMQPLLRDLGGYERLVGTGDMSIKFLGVGNSLDAIMNSLSGSGNLRFGKGEILGLDIAGMLRTLDASYVGAGQKTIFEAITASFTMDKGVLRNDDLVFKAPYVTATGAGSVGIGARVLDYRLRPTALAAVDGTGGVMVPLLITGPWAAPKFRLDLEGIAKERLQDEAKKLEERARAEAKAAEARARAQLEQKAQEELGIVRQEGESLEDAAKRRAQEALDAEAGKLLNRLLGGGN
ncbi:MAG: AsmA family protein [Rhodobacteraceae bacterium]|nr:AsmA family protein [Paracoccaceae bacterium]MCF8516332.1 AsmA family protein [Paracoccaceae bacterium]MCF8520682.1 AsmA family protein [Paracoccaceae bacterium]